MNPHFFTAPFYFAFIWFRVQSSRFKVQGSGFKVQGSGFRVQGSGFRVQGSGFRVQVAAKPPPYNKAPSTSVGMTFKKDG